MKLIILIIVVFILPEIIALIPNLANKDVGNQTENTDQKIDPQKTVILTSSKRKTGSGGPIRRNAKQNTTSNKKPDTSSKNERYNPYQKPVIKKPQVILSVPHELKMPDKATIRDFEELGRKKEDYTGVYPSSLDYCATEIIDRYKRFHKDWIYIPQELGHYILFYNPEATEFNKKFYKMKLKGKKIAMAYTNSMSWGHSRCLIVDMNLKTVEYYDSAIQGLADDYDYYCRDGIEFFKSWKLALKRRNLKSTEKISLQGWKFIQPKFKTRRQISGVHPPDCSIYVVMFIDGRINGAKRVIKSDNAVKVRRALYKVFIRNITKKPSTKKSSTKKPSVKIPSNKTVSIPSLFNIFKKKH